MDRHVNGTDEPRVENAAEHTVACETCGLVQHVGRVPEGFAAQCARCNTHLFHRRPNSCTRTFAFALAALILYFPSNFYPLVSTQYHGLRSQTTVLGGIKSLFEHEQYFIGALVFCTSILSPALKIIGLLIIPWTVGRPEWRRTRMWAYKVIRIVDPWNMLEVFLLAIAVSMIEMGRVATVHPGPGIFSFAAVVALTLMATLSFDPRLLWDEPLYANRNHKKFRQE